MEHWPVGMAILGVLLMLGVPISFALAGVGLVGVASIIGWIPAMFLMGSAFFDTGRDYSL